MAAAVTLGWVKSHIGVREDERADEQAKKGAGKRATVLQAFGTGM